MSILSGDYCNYNLLCRCEAVLGEFLRGIKRESKNVNFADMVNILVIHSQSEGDQKLMQLTELNWLFIKCRKAVHLHVAADVDVVKITLQEEGL